MIHAQILTPWDGDGLSLETAYHPQLTDDYPSILRYTDVTNQMSEQIIPSPNLFVAQFEMDATTLAQIEQDNNYLILWSVDNGE